MTRPDADGYTGPARLTVGAVELTVRVELRGQFEPIGGRYRWYGRVARHDRLTELLAGGRTRAELRTEHGASPCELAEPDLWERYRVVGVSTPPFPVAGLPAS